MLDYLAVFIVAPYQFRISPQPHSMCIRDGKMYQFQLPSTSSSAKFPGVGGIKPYLHSTQIQHVFIFSANSTPRDCFLHSNTIAVSG